MSTLTPRLQLKRNDGSDPFKRQDFTDNWNKIDAAPGVHICTSTSRPTWGASQAGRRILETDTRAEYEWSGTAFLAKGATATYTLGSITTSRPGSLMVDLQGIFASMDTAAQAVEMAPLVNGAEINTGSGFARGFVQWTGSNNDGGYQVYETTSAKGLKAVNKGTYTIQAKVTVNTYSTLSVMTWRLAANVLLVNEASR
jgi:hypothetical protein